VYTYLLFTICLPCKGVVPFLLRSFWHLALLAAAAAVADAASTHVVAGFGIREGCLLFTRTFFYIIIHYLVASCYFIFYKKMLSPQTRQKLLAAIRRMNCIVCIRISSWQ
jgi:hypothetical protein